MYEKKQTILVLVDFYLPGFKAGGPINAVANLVEKLSEKLDFLIVTRDRDLGDAYQYPNIQVNRFISFDRYQIYYQSPELFSLWHLRKLLMSNDYDVLYLNSFFSLRYSILPMLIRYFSLNRRPTVIAPRGEFHPGALAGKSFKKKLFLSLSKCVGLHRAVMWQASSDEDKASILSVFPKAKVMLAGELVANQAARRHVKKEDKLLRLVFLGRICPHKNLLGTLEMLVDVLGEIRFDIYGVIEDREYFEKCQQLIASLPGNIKVTYKGVVEHVDVPSVMAQYDLFILMSLSENYGYAIIEALLAGTPVLIHDKTPWCELANRGAGYIYPLTEIPSYCSTIERLASMMEDEHVELRSAAKSFAMEHVNNDEAAIRANFDLLTSR